MVDLRCLVCTQTSSSDPDGDFIYAPNDNCPDTANSDQADLDGDLIGDVATTTATAMQYLMTRITAQIFQMQSKPTVTATKLVMRATTKRLSGATAPTFKSVGKRQMDYVQTAPFVLQI